MNHKKYIQCFIKYGIFEVIRVAFIHCDFENFVKFFAVTQCIFNNSN